jgi:hypothetical protein
VIGHREIKYENIDDRLLEVVTFVVPGSDDVTYTHAVFAQCFHNRLRR